MNAVVISHSRRRKPALKAIGKWLRLRLKAPAERPRHPHDWREIEAVRLDYERRKAEISALVRSRAV